MRREPTDAERRLWSLLRGKRLGGHKFRRQEQIGDRIVDFACFEKRLIVEADGSQHADGADAERDAFLGAQGFRVLRLWNIDILTNLEGVAASILAALETPLPSRYRVKRPPDVSVYAGGINDPIPPQGERGNSNTSSLSPLPLRERKGPAPQAWEGEGENGADNG